jgi:hypothetical protein
MRPDTPAAVPVPPTPGRLAWQEAGFGLYLRFGVNMFHGAEWSDGTVDPKAYDAFYTTYTTQLVSQATMTHWWRLSPRSHWSFGDPPAWAADVVTHQIHPQSFADSDGDGVEPFSYGVYEVERV